MTQLAGFVASTTLRRDPTVDGDDGGSSWLSYSVPFAYGGLWGIPLSLQHQHSFPDLEGHEDLVFDGFGTKISYKIHVSVAPS